MSVRPGFGNGVTSNCSLNAMSATNRVEPHLRGRLGVRREDVFISLVFVDGDDWSFGNGEPW